MLRRRYVKRTRRLHDAMIDGEARNTSYDRIRSISALEAKRLGPSGLLARALAARAAVGSASGYPTFSIRLQRDHAPPRHSPWDLQSKATPSATLSLSR